MTVDCYYKFMDKKRYTIEDLCEITGYSRRTIRYYIQEGVVDPPSGRGRGGFYYDSHLKRLLEIRSLQDRGLKLAAIVEVLRKGEEPQLGPVREVWIRHPIKDGIEIHIRRDFEEEERKKVVEIIRVARSILKTGGDNNE